MGGSSAGLGPPFHRCRRNGEASIPLDEGAAKFGLPPELPDAEVSPVGDANPGRLSILDSVYFYFTVISSRFL